MLLGGLGSRAQVASAVTLDLKNATVETVLQKIEEQTPYRFSYQNSVLDKKADITLKVENASVPDVLRKVLTGRKLTFTIVSPESIVIVKEGSASGKTSPGVVRKQISGKIVDEAGEPLTGASITAEGDRVLAVADIEGEFKITVAVGQTLTVSMVGMYPIKFKIDI